ncbi:MAG TPA: adenine deaminase, partial [candidate division Zixibacteria bacterium]|nr:adenine deaminase [candidate division Zixibacteria bacterium]
MDKEYLIDLIKVAKSDAPADIVLRGAKVVSTHTGEIFHADVAVFGDTIAGVGKYDGKEIVELGGGYLVPGLIDSHCHIESSMV